MNITEKLEKLQNILKGYEKVCVAYSGGTDSDFLLNVAARTLGKRHKHGFRCSQCGHLAHSDLNASRNLQGLCQQLSAQGLM